MSSKKSVKPKGTKKAQTKTKSSTNARTKKNSGRVGDSDLTRSQLRVPINLLVDYRANGSFLFDFCKNLGTGGVFIETKTPLPHGSDIDLTFTIPDSKETLTTTGKVIWIQEEIADRKDLTPGMGVQFLGFDAKHKQLLEQFIIRCHPDPLSVSVENNLKKKPA